MTKRQKSIVLGLLLGDGHLEKNGKAVRLRIDQGLSHKDYVNWLHNELTGLIPSKPRIIRQRDKRTKKVYSRLHVSTYSCEELKNWWDIFYANRKKVIPSNIADMLKSDISLAVWFMDDGYKRNDCAAIRLNTDAFSIDEQSMLVRCLGKNFKIMARIHKKGKWFNIYLPKGEAKKFSDLIKPYILPSFRYKLL